MSMNNGKKIMRIAMIGISPADQVAFKGYLRVLLRLDVELEWAKSISGTIDLFVINDEFRNSSSVINAIEQHEESALLYVAKNNTSSEGRLIGNLLTLPLKQIRLLHDWLVENVEVLKDVPHTGSTPAEDIQTKTPIRQATVTQPQHRPASDGNDQTKTVDTSFNDVIDLITMLHKRHGSLCELLQDGEVIAIIDPSTQQLWQKNVKPKASHSWRLRLVQGSMNLDQKHAVDMSQWLWNVIWEHAGNLVRLVNSTNTYQLRAWAKPNEMNRRELLRIMTVMEKEPITLVDIASKANVSMSVAQKAVAGLLVAGYLQDANYRNIKVYALNTATPTEKVVGATHETVVKPTVEAKPATNTAPSQPTPNVEQEEKMGFLARLRRKLGI